VVSHDIVVVGASAGGVEPLMRLAAGLAPDLPAAVFVALHVPPDSPSALPAILSRAGPLPAAHAVDGEAIQPGRIYVASPNHHLYVHRGHVRVMVGPRENGSRPSVDVLFRSASRAYGRRVVGVVLSGALSDGSLGLAAIKLRGGTAIVQDPAEALFAGMPDSAIRAASPDYCMPVAEMAATIEMLVRQPREQLVSEGMDNNAEVHEESPTDEPADMAIAYDKQPGNASGLTCPECFGSIWELQDGDSVRFECRVGHAYAAEAFVAQQGERIEAALWTAINSLEERAETFSRLAGAYTSSSRVANRYHERASEITQQVGVLRNLLYALVQVGDVN
jgi:two-component system, chemotaxis family, protein-glutamate methylesterase/glutaminase